MIQSAASFIYALGQELERSNRNMPVAYCCRQFKNWWLPLFLPVPRKGKNANSTDVYVCASAPISHFGYNVQVS